MIKSYVLIKGAEGLDAVDVTRFIGGPVGLTHAVGTAGVTKDGQRLAISLVQLTKRKAAELQRRPLEFPTADTASLQRWFRKLQRRRKGGDVVVVNVGSGNTLLKAKIKDGRKLYITPPEDLEKGRVRQSRAALKVRLAITNAHGALVPISSTGYFGEPDTDVSLAAVVKRVLDLMLGLPEAAEEFGFDSVTIAWADPGSEPQDSPPQHLYVLTDDGDLIDGTPAIGSPAALELPVGMTCTLYEENDVLVLGLTSADAGSAFVLDAATHGLPLTGSSRLAASLRRWASQIVPGDIGESLLPASISVDTGGEHFGVNLELALGAQVQVLGLSQEEEGRQFTQLNAPMKVLLQVRTRPSELKNDFDVTALSGLNPTLEQYSRAAVAISVSTRFGSPGSGHSIARLVLHALALALAVPECAAVLTGGRTIDIVVPPTSSSGRLVIGSTSSTVGHADNIALLDAAALKLLAGRSETKAGDVDLLADLLTEIPTTVGRIAQELRNLTVDDDGLRAHPESLRVRALLVLEHLVERSVEDADTDDQSLQLFAAVATEYQLATLRRYERQNWAGWSRLMHLVNEWLSGSYQRPWSSTTELSAANYGPERLAALLSQAPWLSYLFRRSPKLPVIAIDTNRLVETLALAQPQFCFIKINKRFLAEQRKVRGLEVGARFLLKSSAADAVEADSDLINDLCDVVADLYSKPSLVLRRAQRLARHPEVLNAVEGLAEAGVATVMGGPESLRVLTDIDAEGERQIVLVNAAESQRLAVEVQTQKYLLREFASSETGAYGYTSEPVALSRPQDIRVVVGDIEQVWSLPPRERMRPIGSAGTEWVETRMFRGRKEELQRLLSLMAKGLPVRQPAVIYGTRRAGKTTLAVQACRQGIERGMLSATWVIDVANDPDSSTEEGYVARLANVFREVAADHLGVADLEQNDDPVRVLRSLDQRCQERGVVMALVLDEFDTLLVRDQASPLRILAARLGSLAWRNVLLVCTVQRFSKRSAELKSTTMIECSPDLDWLSGVTYFCPTLEDVGGLSAVSAIDGPVVLPAVFQEVVHSRLGLRPYFWGQLMDRLENWVAAHPEKSRFIATDIIARMCDQMVREDMFLSIPQIPDEGLSLEERRRKDLFSNQEKKILARWATTKQIRVSIKDATKLGGADALSELLERRYLVRSSTEGVVELAVPIFGEWLRLNRHDFLPVRGAIEAADVTE